MEKARIADLHLENYRDLFWANLDLGFDCFLEVN